MLPPLDDELAKAASEFDTFDALRTEIEERLTGEIDDELEGAVPRGGRRRARARDELHRRPARSSSSARASC